MIYKCLVLASAFLQHVPEFGWSTSVAWEATRQAHNRDRCIVGHFCIEMMNV